MIDKHLTSAECCAEFWKATSIANAAEHPMSDVDADLATERFEVWHRFATHPHAHKEEK